MISLKKGQNVTYVPEYGPAENGRVKSVCKEGKYVFVVYNCAGNWHRISDYTAARTRIKDLEEGWDETIETKYSDEYLDYLEESF